MKLSYSLNNDVYRLVNGKKKPEINEGHDINRLTLLLILINTKIEDSTMNIQKDLSTSLEDMTTEMILNMSCAKREYEILKELRDFVEFLIEADKDTYNAKVIELCNIAYNKVKGDDLND